MKISVIGAGNGGQAVSGDLSMKGHIVTLYDRNSELIDVLNSLGSIELEGKISGIGYVKCVSNIEEALLDADLIMILTTATAHGALAEKMAPYLRDGQVIVLNPGRTGGALEFKERLNILNFNKRIYLAEAQTLMYACRIREVGHVHIIGVKDRVFLSALPASDTKYVLDLLKTLYTCFIPAENILRTSFENIGAIFHPSVILFNAASIERGDKFYFYREMTSSIADFIENLDQERLNLGKAYGVELISAKDWVSFAYEGIKGENLCERMQNNPAYYDILAPTTIHCRQLLEDIPTGFVPLLEFGKIANIKMPLFESMLPICSTLLHTDFYTNGRTLQKMGLEYCKINDIFNKII